MRAVGARRSIRAQSKLRPLLQMQIATQSKPNNHCDAYGGNSASPVRKIGPRIFPGFVCRSVLICASLGLDKRPVFYKKSLLLLRLGRIAQRESVPFTRERSKVRSLVRPPATSNNIEEAAKRAESHHNKSPASQ
jgi:hypothetical protein